MLATTDEVKALLSQGKTLLLAGEEKLLRALPRGRWIGGTIPYFMDADGGRTTRELVSVQEVSPLATSSEVAVYDTSTISRVGVESPDSGYTILIIPAFSELHQRYALKAPTYDQLFLKVVAGWIAGTHLDDVGKVSPKVFAGTTGEAYDTRAVALHIELPRAYRAQVNIANIFEKGTGDDLQFPASGFSATDCLVNGEKRNFAEYFRAQGLDKKAPLVADFCGAMVNVSIQAVEGDTVKLYAPVFQDVTYRFARPVENYPQRFAEAIPKSAVDPAFSCNCILNYVYGHLEGRQTGAMLGPMTFGEIAFQLLNQTLVYVTVEKAGPGC
jgi:hypothetical protein